MEEILESKKQLRQHATDAVAAIPASEKMVFNQKIEGRLLNFANFLEANIVLLYISRGIEVPTGLVIQRCYEYGKIVVLPFFDPKNGSATLFKVDNPKTDLIANTRAIPEPDPQRCKQVPIDRIDIALVPGLAFDEKGGRIGLGDGFYDRLIPDLAITTRKVALAYECQLFSQIPMESHDRFVDIIITPERIIYKI